jgi:hypothetical protein
VDVCFQREARAVMAQPYLNLLCVSPLGEQH